MLRQKDLFCMMELVYLEVDQEAFSNLLHFRHSILTVPTDPCNSKDKKTTWNRSVHGLSQFLISQLLETHLCTVILYLHFLLPYRQCRYISRQPWLQPSDHALASFFAQLAFWHFSAATESSAVHEPYLQTERRHLVCKCEKLVLLADSEVVTMNVSSHVLCPCALTHDSHNSYTTDICSSSLLHGDPLVSVAFWRDTIVL